MGRGGEKQREGSGNVYDVASPDAHSKRVTDGAPPGESILRAADAERDSEGGGAGGGIHRDGHREVLRPAKRGRRVPSRRTD